jgi:hypothetical protein
MKKQCFQNVKKYLKMNDWITCCDPSVCEGLTQAPTSPLAMRGLLFCTFMKASFQHAQNKSPRHFVLGACAQDWHNTYL